MSLHVWFQTNSDHFEKGCFECGVYPRCVREPIQEVSMLLHIYNSDLILVCFSKFLLWQRKKNSSTAERDVCGNQGN